MKIGKGTAIFLMFLLIASCAFAWLVNTGMQQVEEKKRAIELKESLIEEVRAGEWVKLHGHIVSDDRVVFDGTVYKERWSGTIKPFSLQDGKGDVIEVVPMDEHLVSNLNHEVGDRHQFRSGDDVYIVGVVRMQGGTPTLHFQAVTGHEGEFPGYYGDFVITMMLPMLVIMFLGMVINWSGEWFIARKAGDEGPWNNRSRRSYHTCLAMAASSAITLVMFIPHALVHRLWLGSIVVLVVVIVLLLLRAQKRLYEASHNTTYQRYLNLKSYDQFLVLLDRILSKYRAAGVVLTHRKIKVFDSNHVEVIELPSHGLTNRIKFYKHKSTKAIIVFFEPVTKLNVDVYKRLASEIIDPVLEPLVGPEPIVLPVAEDPYPDFWGEAGAEQ